MASFAAPAPSNTYDFDFDFQTVLRRPTECPLGLQMTSGQHEGLGFFVVGLTSCAAEYNQKLEVSGLKPIMANMIRVGDEVQKVNGFGKMSVIQRLLQDRTEQALFITLRRRSWEEHEMPPWLRQAITNRREMLRVGAAAAAAVQPEEEPVMSGPEWQSREVVQDYDPPAEPEAGYLAARRGDLVHVQTGSATASSPGNRYRCDYVFGHLAGNEGWVPLDIFLGQGMQG